MRILITGAYGQLGVSLYQILNINHDIYNTGINIPKSKKGLHLNILDKVQVKSLVNYIKPDLVINLAALTNVDFCESNSNLAAEVNINGVKNIYDSFDGKIIHLSTDYVFDGLNGPYFEEDQVNPISIYGKTKLKSEKIILKREENLVLRANVLYDAFPNNKFNFLNWIIENLKNGKQINIVDDQYNNPTWTSSIAKVINLCIKNNIHGLFHWGDDSYLSRYEFSLKIAKKFNLDSSLIKKISTKELGQIAPRPLKGGLKKENLETLLKIKAPSVDNCLDQIFLKSIK